MANVLTNRMPRSVREYVGASRYLGWFEYLRICVMAPRYRRRWERLRPQTLGSDQVFIPPDYILNVPERFRYSFEAAQYQNVPFVEEVGSFARATRGMKRCYDIGAEAGLFSLIFTRDSTASALAWEPSPPQLEKLRESVLLNPGRTIEICPIACGPEDGSLDMVFDGVQLRAATTGEGDGVVKKVIVRSIDSMVTERGIAPDAIKIDIEGFEYGALQGGAESFRQHRPMLFLEVHPPQLAHTGRTVEDVFRFLAALRYTIFNTRGKRLIDPVRSVGRRITRVVCSPA